VEVLVRSFRSCIAFTLSVGVVVLLAPASGWAGSTEADGCETLPTLMNDVQEVGSSEFDADAFDDLASAFRKSAKSAPKQIKGALKKLGKAYVEIAKADSREGATAAFLKLSDEYSQAFSKLGLYLGEHCTAGGSTASGSGGGGGTLVLGDETIELDSARCFLREQASAGGGGKILLTGQGTGTNAAGEEVRLDFTRYDEASQFTGDDISVEVGPLADATSYTARLDLGAVDRSGSTLTATDIPFQSFGDRGITQVTGSFTLNC
jgi:hypothetical protein